MNASTVEFHGPKIKKHVKYGYKDWKIENCLKPIYIIYEKETVTKRKNEANS